MIFVTNYNKRWVGYFRNVMSHLKNIICRAFGLKIASLAPLEGQF